MSTVNPVVRYLIVCDDVQTNPEHANRVSLLGLIGIIRTSEQPSFPLLFRELCVFVELTECRGSGDARIEIQHADSGHVAFRTKTRTLSFNDDPLEIVGMAFRIRNCLFTDIGLYWVQFWYNDQMIAQQALVLR